MSEKPSPEEIRARVAAMEQKVVRVFETDDGADVLEYMMDRFYNNNFTETEEVKLARLVGRRDVMLALRNIMKRGKS